MGVDEGDAVDVGMVSQPDATQSELQKEGVSVNLAHPGA